MNINWKVRIKNPVFWVQLAVAVMAPILAAAGVAWEQITSWPALGQVIAAGIGNPVVVVAILAAVWAAINDPTTVGLGDSERAMTYLKPRKDEIIADAAAEASAEAINYEATAAAARSSGDDHAQQRAD